MLRKLFHRIRDTAVRLLARNRVLESPAGRDTHTAARLRTVPAPFSRPNRVDTASNTPPLPAGYCGKLPSWVERRVQTPIGKVVTIKTVLSPADRRGRIICRLSDRFRSKYRIEPGLYAVGDPAPTSEVFVTGNYKMTFDILRENLHGMNCWVLVLDTKGICVWCAAGKGTFGTKELVCRIAGERLKEFVTHRRVIVPQLGAPGISAHQVKEESGFSVLYGPVRASDIPAFVNNEYAASPRMRRVTFSIRERIAQIPMELSRITRTGCIALAVIAIIMGLEREGILFHHALTLTAPLAFGFLAASIAGAVLHPLFLPLFPFRAFAIQGAAIGIVAAIPFAVHRGLDPYAKAAIVIGIIALSSWLALNFAGCTTFANKSGVRRELSRAWPFYYAAVLLTLAALILYKLGTAGSIA